MKNKLKATTMGLIIGLTLTTATIEVFAQSEATAGSTGSVDFTQCTLAKSDVIFDGKHYQEYACKHEQGMTTIMKRID